MRLASTNAGGRQHDTRTERERGSTGVSLQEEIQILSTLKSIPKVVWQVGPSRCLLRRARHKAFTH